MTILDYCISLNSVQHFLVVSGVVDMCHLLQKNLKIRGGEISWKHRHLNFYQFDRGGKNTNLYSIIVARPAEINLQIQTLFLVCHIHQYRKKYPLISVEPVSKKRN